MEGNNNYDQLLPGSNLLTDLAEDDKLLQELANYEGKPVASEAIDLSPVVEKPVAKPKPKSKPKSKPKTNTVNSSIASYAITALAIFVVFFLMFYPKTASLFNALGSIDSTKGIAIRGGILALVSVAVSIVVKFIL